MELWLLVPQVNSCCLSLCKSLIQSTNYTGLAFRKQALGVDYSRPLAANGNTNGIDVQGHSHSGNATFQSFHKKNPSVPQVLSECCSCTTQRAGGKNDRKLATCEPDQNSPGLLPYVTGSLGVWTLFDYFGEPASRDQQSSSFGQLGIAGFPKPHIWWYYANWAAGQAASEYGRPQTPIGADKPVVRILAHTHQLNCHAPLCNDRCH